MCSGRGLRRHLGPGMLPRKVAIVRIAGEPLGDPVHNPLPCARHAFLKVTSSPIKPSLMAQVLNADSDAICLNCSCEYARLIRLCLKISLVTSELNHPSPIFLTSA